MGLSQIYWNTSTLQTCWRISRQACAGHGFCLCHHNFLFRLCCFDDKIILSKKWKCAFRQIFSGRIFGASLVVLFIHFGYLNFFFTFQFHYIKKVKIKVYWSLKGCTWIIMPLSLYQLKNGLKTTILSFISIISGTIYCPAKCVIVTGLVTRMIIFMSKLCTGACVRSWPTIPCRSPPLPTVPGPRKCTVLEYGAEQTNCTFGVKHVWARYRLPSVSSP